MYVNQTFGHMEVHRFIYAATGDRGFSEDWKYSLKKVLLSYNVLESEKSSWIC